MIATGLMRVHDHCGNHQEDEDHRHRREIHVLAEQPPPGPGCRAEHHGFCVGEVVAGQDDGAAVDGEAEPADERPVLQELEALLTQPHWVRLMPLSSTVAGWWTRWWRA